MGMGVGFQCRGENFYPFAHIHVKELAFQAKNTTSAIPSIIIVLYYAIFVTIHF